MIILCQDCKYKKVCRFVNKPIGTIFKRDGIERKTEEGNIVKEDFHLDIYDYCLGKKRKPLNKFPFRWGKGGDNGDKQFSQTKSKKNVQKDGSSE